MASSTTTRRDLRDLLDNRTSAMDDLPDGFLGELVDIVIEAADKAGIERTGGTYENYGDWVDGLGEDAWIALVDRACAVAAE